MTNEHIGVMLMTYGSPATLDDIPTYLKNVRGGRQADEALITEFRRRYALIGGSPLLRITREQAAALQEELNNQHPDGPLFHVVAGMRFAPPFISDLVQQALDRFPEEVRKRVPVLLTAHSMPKRVIDREPDYIKNLKETATRVAELVGLPEERWMFCYQ